MAAQAFEYHASDKLKFSLSEFEFEGSIALLFTRIV